MLTDCVPSKTLIATSESMTALALSPRLGVRFNGGADHDAGTVGVDLAQVNARVKSLAQAQSDDIAARLSAGGRRRGARLGPAGRPQGVRASPSRSRRQSAAEYELEADAVLLATGAHPRVLPTAQPDGERILTWHQVYDLDRAAERLIVVGSGVTGAEFAGAYQALGLAGHARVLARPGAARRGRRRGRGRRGGLPPARHDGARTARARRRWPRRRTACW